MAGVQVVKDPSLGRCVVATRAFAKGDRILSESPLLVWPLIRGDDLASYRGMLRAFGRSSDMTKALVRDLACPSPLATESPVVRSAWSVAEALAPEFAEKIGDASALVRLILSCVANAHEFWSADAAGKALYALSSKSNHSCSPTAVLSQSQSVMSFTSRRSIAVGDHITFSYLEDVASTPTCERRLELQSRYDFSCRCSACTGPDPLRSMVCPQCKKQKKKKQKKKKNKALVLPTIVMETTRWSCSQHGDLSDDELVIFLEESSRVESALSAELDGLLPQLEAAPGAALPMAESAESEIFAEVDLARLGPTHHLQIRLRVLRATAYASLANALDTDDDIDRKTRAARLRLRSAKSSLEAVRLCECASAQCLHPTATCDHEPLTSCVGRALDAARLWLLATDLLPPPDDEDPTCRSLAKYAPLFLSLLGAAVHPEVKRLQDRLKPPASASGVAK